MSGNTALRLGDVLTERRETLGTRDETVVLTLTEKNGFVPQSERFNKRLATEDTSKYKVVRRGDFAFNPYLLWAGAIAMNDRVDEGVVSPLYPIFSVNDGFNTSYLRHLLLSPPMVVRYDSIAFGSVPRRRRSSVRDFLDLELPAVPPLDEQRRIAAVLDHVNTLRAKRAEAVQQREMLRGAIFATMFSGGYWSSTLLGDLLARIDSGKSPVCLDRPAEMDEWSVLKLGAISSGVYRDDENKAIRSETTPDPRHEVRPGDLLFSRKNTRELVGACVHVTATAPRRLLPDLVFRLVPACRDAFDPAYMADALRAPRSRRRIQEMAGGSAASMVNISKTKLMTLPVLAPPIDLQREYAQRVGALDQVGRSVESHLTSLDELFSSLQSHAFSGELDVSRVSLP